MYSERNVATRLDLVEAEYTFRPTYRTIEEVDWFENHLRKTYGSFYDEAERRKPEKPHEFLKEALSDRLQQWEVNWMLNERLLSMSDAAYALTRYCWIKSEQNVIQRFYFRVAQKIIFDIIADLEDIGGSIELIILKARQLGISTVWELLFVLRIIFSYGANAILASADQQKSGLMQKMMLDCYDLMPWWYKPTYTRRVESDKGMLVFGQLKSGVSVQHGAQMSGIARGTTPTLYHLSEVASFTNPVEQIDKAIFKCVHSSPAVLGGLESSGEGDKGWFPDTWRYSKENWPQRKSRLCPKFLPWFVGKDLYPTLYWSKLHPVPYNWKPLPDTREHVAKCQLYVSQEESLRKYLGKDWKMPIEQQYFWEIGYEEAKYKGEEGGWLQEMAADDEESLQKSAESVFGNQTIYEIQSRRTKEYRVYGISGAAVEDRHEPPIEDIDYDSERIPVVYRNRKDQEFRWDFLPLKFGQGFTGEDEDELKTIDPTGKLFIYHPPTPGVDYALGVDTCAGKGQDSTVISVWTIGKAGDPDVQCAEFSSCYVSHVESYAFCTAIAAHYGIHLNKLPVPKQEPLCIVEQVAAVGDVAQHQMKVSFGYRRFPGFVRLDQKKVITKKAVKQGWFTYSWSRPILIDGFVNYAQNLWIEINSPWLIDEMRHFEVHVTKSGKEKFEHEDDEHDDRIFAAAMGTVVPHLHMPMLERSKKRFTLREGELPRLDLRPGWQVNIPLPEKRERVVYSRTR